MVWQATHEAVFLGVAGVSGPDPGRRRVPSRLSVVRTGSGQRLEASRRSSRVLRGGGGPSSDLLAALTVAKEVRPCVGGGRRRPGLGVGGGPALPGLRVELDHNPVTNF